jgi:hypothetical protein
VPPVLLFPGAATDSPQLALTADFQRCRVGCLARVLSLLICRTVAQSTQVCILQLVESSARRILGWLQQVV